MENKINIRTAVISWLFTAAYMGIIFYLSSLTFDTELPSNSDKIIHIIIYGPLALLLYKALKGTGIRKHLFAASLILAGLYGITDEIHQSFVPGRDAAAGDAVADFIGAFVGCYIAGRTIKK